VTPPKGAANQLAGALAPVGDQLLRTARADAERLLARADRSAQELLEDARAHAESLLDEARRQGEADAARERGAELTRVHRIIRARELAARRQAYDELCRRTTRRVRELRQSAEYPAIRERLYERARRLLGPRAEIAEHEAGGVVARAPGRRADCTLDDLAARALDRLGARAETLWIP
jgi:vacuolar-type H+-ATPase subunit E/Vma4